MCPVANFLRFRFGNLTDSNELTEQDETFRKVKANLSKENLENRNCP